MLHDSDLLVKSRWILLQCAVLGLVLLVLLEIAEIVLVRLHNHISLIVEGHSCAII